MAALDTTGLKPLDTTGLRPAKTLDTSGLKALDTTGLTPMEPGGRAGFLPQLGRGVQAGVEGAKGMGAAFLHIPSYSAFKTASENLRAFDAIDEGQSLPEGMGRPAPGVAQAADPIRQYRAASPEVKAALRERTMAQMADMQDARGALLEAWKEYSEEAKAKQGRVPNFTDIKDVAGFRDWLGFNMGQGAPYIAVSMLAGLFGGLPGVAASGYIMGAGDIQGEFLERGIEDKGDLALAAAPAYAATEFLGPAGRMLRNISKSTLDQVAKGYFRRLGREIPANFVEEFVNEASQAIITDATVKSVTGEPIVTEESLLQWFNEGMAGGAAGGPMGTVTAIPGPGDGGGPGPGNLTPDDRLSPQRNQDISEGKQVIDEALREFNEVPAGAQPAEDILGAEPRTSATDILGREALEPAPAGLGQVYPDPMEAFYDTQRGQQVGGAVAQGPQPGQVRQREGGPEAPAAGGILQAPGQEEDGRGAVQELDTSGLTEIDATPKQRAPSSRPDSLLEFLTRRGGVRDTQGELAAIGATKWKKPFLGKLVKEEGEDLDMAREAAEQAGYIPEGLSVAEFVSYIDQEMRGSPVYTDEGRQAIEAREAEVAAQDFRRDAKNEIRGLAQRWNEDFSEREINEIYDAMEAGGLTADEAVGDYIERLALQDEAELDNEVGQDAEPLPTRPAEDGGAPRAPLIGPKGFVRDEEEGPEDRQAAAEPGERPQAPEVEATAQGLQAVIPGAERISDREQAERGMEGRQRARAPQRAADEGLFDVAGRGQRDLLDQPPAEEDLTKLGLAELSERATARVETDYGFTPTPQQATGIAIDVQGGKSFSDAVADMLLEARTRKAKIVPVRKGEGIGVAVIPEKAEQTKTKTRELIDNKRGERVRKLREDISKGKSWKTITELRQEYGVQPGTQQAKTLEEDFESALVEASRRLNFQAEAGNDPDVIGFKRQVDLYSRQPKLGTRTSGSVQRQAYSTPAPIAYLAGKLAGITSTDRVYEPSAGNGMLLTLANPKRTLANELDGERAANLGALGFSVEQRDASDWRPSQEFDVVIMNPPFGVVKDAEGQSRTWRPIPESPYETTEIDHAISLKALEAMKDDGRAVLIIGGPAKTARSEEARSSAYNSKAKREYFKTLYDRYNVVDHFTVAGELYERQGAGWPVDVIVIQGRGKSARMLPAADVPPVYSSFEEIEKEFFDGQNGKIKQRGLGAAPEGGAQPGAGVGRGDRPQPQAPEQGGLPSAAGVQAGRPSEAGAGPGGGAAGGGAAVRAGGAVEGAGGRAPGAGRDTGDGAGPGGGQRRISGAPEPEGLPGTGRVGQPEVRPEPGGPAGTEAGRPSDVARPADTGTERALEDDFDTIFDEELAAAFEEEAAPEESAADLLRKAAEALEQEKKPRARKARKRTKKTQERTAGEAAKSAAKETIEGLDDVASGLTRLFGGDPKRLGAGPSFDEETYRQAKPYFIKGAKHFQQAGADVRDMVRALIGALRDTYNFTREAIEAMRPYLKRFVEEVRSGVISLTEKAATATEPRTRREPKREQETETQVSYDPQSAVGGFGTLVPVNLKDSTSAALKRLEAEVGFVDEYVARELGYKTADLGKYFGAEQVDAIALALSNLSRNSGFIIGDQTGIGKGRFVAAMIRWAIRNGKTPIFVTEKPNLYGDMYRDLNNIGVDDIRPLMTNANEKVPLNDEETVTLRTPQAGKHNAALQEMVEAGGLDDQYNMIFTNYSQMQTLEKARTVRMDFLEAMARGGVVIFDESHNAGGTEAGDPRGKKAEELSRASFARDLAALADSVVYSSATYAKRPSVMSLYFKTDMRLAVGDIKDLGPAIQKGGVPMQQAVASMLTRAGQYIRRERSFAGVNYNSPLVSAGDPKTYRQFSQALKLVQNFSEVYVPVATKNIDKTLKAQAKAISHDGSTGGAGAKSTNFTSVMHNLVDQMLLAIKAPQAVEHALKALERGEKPVITVSGTLESIITQYAEQTGLTVGDAINFGFNDLLVRYLERSRTVSLKEPFSKDKAEKLYLTDEMLGPAGVAAFDSAKKAIEAMDLSALPGSPIDYIKGELGRRGYKVGEITGRDLIIKYDAEGNGVLMRRPAKDRSPAGRVRMIRTFNDGTLDAMLVNQAGSTGLSLHASVDFKDQRPRHMIIAQPEKNIDTHMQLLGRVHRTGQVVVPTYTQLIADIPAEKRPAAVLAKKMASLNANTTGARSGAMTAKDTPDFLNDYGDQVIAQIMMDNPDIHQYLGKPLSETETGLDPDEAARKVTGRIPLLPVEDQESLYDMIEAEYAAFLEEKRAAGESALEALALDLDAVVEARDVAVQGQEGGSPFAEPAYAEVLDVKRLGKPHSTEAVLEAIQEATGKQPQGQDNLKRLQSMRQTYDASEALDSFKGYRAELIDSIEDTKKADAQDTRLTDIAARFRKLIQSFPIGETVSLTRGEDKMYGVVARIRQTGKSKNPLALGSWKMTVYLADPRRQLEVPFSQLFTPGDPRADAANATLIERDTRIGMTPIIDAFNEMQTEAREKRLVLTGNLLAAFDHVDGKGQIVNLTYRDGTTRQGILMPRGFDYTKYKADQPVVFQTAEQVLEYIEATNRKERVFTTDGDLSIGMDNSGKVTLRASAAKARGGQYYLNERIIGAVGEFVKSGNYMRADVMPSQAAEAIQALLGMNVRLQATQSLNIARQVAGTDEGGEKFSLPRATGDIFISALINQVDSLNQPKAKALQWKGIINNLRNKGVKQEEIDWSGVQTWLDSKKNATVTKDELLQFLNENRVQVQEVTKGRPEDESRFIELDNRFGTDNPLSPEEHAEWVRLSQFDPATKFSDYTLPGGENYRELLLTLPARDDQNYLESYLRSNFALLTEIRSPDDLNTAQQFNLQLRDAIKYLSINDAYKVVEEVRSGRKQPQPDYRDPHFDEPNILAHVRFNERTDAEGNRVLFVEEIQSGWHQAGRKEGYKVGFSPDRALLREMLEEYIPNTPEDAVDAAAEEAARGPDSFVNFMEVNLGVSRQEARTVWMGLDAPSDVATGVPDAPFKSSWHELAFKRMLRYAAENGFDKVAWTTGEQQAERYDLSKQVDTIDVLDHVDGGRFLDIRKDGRSLSALSVVYDENGTITDGLAEFKGKHLEDVVGKDMAKKILDLPPTDQAVERGEAETPLPALPEGWTVENRDFFDDGEGNIPEWAMAHQFWVLDGRTDEVAGGPTEEDAIRAAMRGRTSEKEIKGYRVKRFEGLDLRVGGEGMKGFYDKILPNFANKYGKKWGARVEPTDIRAPLGKYEVREWDGPEGRWRVVGVDGAHEYTYQFFNAKKEAEAAAARENVGDATKVWSLPITDKMRESVMQGQPLFARTDRLIPGLKADLEKRLDKLGLSDKVKVQAVDKIISAVTGRDTPAQGRYMNRLIEVVMGSDEAWVMDHEAIHALRDLGLFKSAEWRTLEKAVRADKKRMAEIRKRYAGQKLTEAELVEEAVADAFADWSAGRRVAKGFIRNAFERVRNFLRALNNALRGNGFRSAEDVFAAVESGQVGRGEVGGMGAGRERFAAPEIVEMMQGTALRSSAGIAKKTGQGWKVKSKVGKVYPSVRPGAHPGETTDVKFVKTKREARAELERLGRTGRSRFAIAPVGEGDRGTWNGRPFWSGAFDTRDGEIIEVHTYKQAAAADFHHSFYFSPRAVDAMERGTAAFFWVDKNGIQTTWREGQAPARIRQRLNEQIGREEKFSLPRSEDGATSESRRRVAQNIIARGQPVDRAFAFMFDVFGGLDQRREWNPTKNLTTWAGRHILESKFPTTGPFSWLNTPLHAARVGLIDRYGLDPEYVRTERKAKQYERGILLQGKEFGEAMSGLSSTEARVLHAAIVGEEIDDADMAKLAMPIREAVDHMGQEAVRYGLVSPESYERNKGSYLHRVYAKHEENQSKLGRWTSGFMEGRRKKIIGNTLKGRGIFLDIDAKRLTRDDPEFAKGAAGRPVKGQKYIVLDKIPEQTELDLSSEKANTRKPQVEKRVYLPADRSIPPKYAGFIHQGTWEVRRTLGNKVTIWRDYTPEERAQMGEILDARYTVVKTFTEMARDLATGKFFSDIAKNPSWTRNDIPNGKWMNGSEYNWQKRLLPDEDLEWVKVPDTTIPDTGGKKRWGALAGKYVRAEIWRDLNELDILNKRGLWNTLLTQWKLNKTARSPVVHMNNIMSNFFFMDMADVRLQDLAKGIRSYVTQDAEFQEAAANGAFGSDMISQEIKRDILEPLLDELQQKTVGGNPLTLRFGLLGKLADTLWKDVYKRGDRWLVRGYQMEDEIFRMAMYHRRRMQGDSPEDAANEAREQFLDYDIRAPWINLARRSVLPFISYTYRAIPVIAKSFAHRPWKLAKYATLAYLANELAYMLAPGDEDEERRSLRPDEKGLTWIPGVPRMVRWPVIDENGNPVMQDIRRWIPAGDVFDMNQGNMAFSIPAPLQMGGPLMLVAEFMLNKSAFTGEEITNPLTDTAGDKAGKIASWLYKSWMPSAAYIPGSWYWEKVGNALKGATDRRGQPEDVTFALLSSVGIKIKPQDVQENFRWRNNEFEAQELALKQEQGRLRRQLQQKKISEEAFREAYQWTLEKMARVNAERKKVMEGE